MKYKDILLASNSPRRKELMEDSELPFTICTAQTEEIFRIDIEKEQAIEEIAFEKANAVFERYPDAIVIGADTMVCYKEQMLGKPKSREDAYRMLALLSGKRHEVITGVAILSSYANVIFHEKTFVTFYELEHEMIEWYLDTQEPFDKAGAYGIQSKGKLLVKEIQGDYYNVMGLPIARVVREIKKLQK